MTSIGNPHITLGKQESLFQSLHLKKQGHKKLREWPSSGSNPELLSSCFSVVNCCATMRNQTQCQILSPTKSVQTEVLWLRLAGSFLPWRLLTASSRSCPTGKATWLLRTSSALGICNQLYNCFHSFQCASYSPFSLPARAIWAGGGHGALLRPGTLSVQEEHRARCLRTLNLRENKIG